MSSLNSSKNDGAPTDILLWIHAVEGGSMINRVSSGFEFCACTAEYLMLKWSGSRVVEC
jgi:hypothetical protein